MSQVMFSENRLTARHVFARDVPPLKARWRPNGVSTRTRRVHPDVFLEQAGPAAASVGREIQCVPSVVKGT